jgi:RNA polymerase sigma-70 factor (ECF subfamily)
MGSERQVELDALFERLFSEYRRPILDYVYRLVGDADRAQELCQDVFVRAYKALGDLSGDANHRAWLYRIATNASYDQLRRRRLVKWLPLLEHDGAEPNEVGPERHVVEDQAMQQALEKIPPKYRAPLVLFAVEGYSAREIGEMMGITEGAVKTRLFRAREKMRAVYSGDPE